MVPNFRNGDYFAGIDAATNVMISLSKGEYTADQYTKRSKGTSKPIVLLIPVFIIMFLLIAIRSSRGRGTALGRSIPFWTAFWLLGSMGRGHSGSWNDFSSGSGGFGGGGGKGADRVERRTVGDQTIARDAPVSGFHTDHAAKCRGLADGTAGI